MTRLFASVAAKCTKVPLSHQVGDAPQNVNVAVERDFASHLTLTIIFFLPLNQFLLVNFTTPKSIFFSLSFFHTCGCFPPLPRSRLPPVLITPSDGGSGGGGGLDVPRHVIHSE